jgi:hypothetical protein
VSVGEKKKLEVVFTLGKACGLGLGKYPIWALIQVKSGGWGAFVTLHKMKHELLSHYKLLPSS